MCVSNSQINTFMIKMNAKQFALKIETCFTDQNMKRKLRMFFHLGGSQTRVKLSDVGFSSMHILKMRIVGGRSSTTSGITRFRISAHLFHLKSLNVMEK